MSQNSEEEELLKIFLEEAKDLLDSIALTLQQWSTDLSNKAYFSDLKRDLHTLKGGARMVNQPNLSAIAHELESLCEALLSGKIPADKSTYDLICAGQDRMNLFIEALAANKERPAVEDLVQQFKQKVTQEKKSPLEDEKPESTLTEAKKEPETSSEKQKVDTNDVIRIKSELLEKLNNLSIENNIVRVNLGHHLDKFKTSLSETIRLVKILHDKLRTNTKAQELRITSDILGLVDTSKTLSQLHSNVESLLSQQSRISLELQERLIDTRMVQFNSVVPRLSRITRQVASNLNKKVDFSVLQAEGEIDRNILDHVVPSLEHLLRNALDHGIEKPEDRKKLNKPEIGKINLRFYRMGNDACMEISDDGSGINLEAVRKKAIKLGLLSQGTVCSDEEVIRYIFEPGFSTRDEISEISGRGVGMDVVNTIVKALGGNLAIESHYGLGTKFIIRLPFTTSMNRALLVAVHGQIFGILLSNVESIVLMEVKQIKETLNKKEPIVYNKKEYHLKYLGEALGIQERPAFSAEKESLPVLFFNFVDYNVALLVDVIIGSQEVVVQTLGPQFKLMDIFSGATLLADGKVLVILDVYSITSRTRRKVNEIVETPALIKKQPIVLVVDDSITIRTVTKNFLERHKYKILTAKDGFDALSKVEDQIPDIILLDVEMPRMDGFQFAEKIKNDARFSQIPIIMITFCTGDEEKQRAKKLGIERFMNKPYRENELLATIEQLLEKK